MRGWVVGGTVAALAIVLVGLAVLTRSSDTTVIIEVRPGECFVIDDRIDTSSATDGVAEIATVRVVGCDEPHHAEVVATGTLNPGRDAPYPSDPELLDLVDGRCAGPLEQAIGDDPNLGALPVAPNEAAWDPTEGRYVCVVMMRGGERMVGHVGGAGPSSTAASGSGADSTAAGPSVSSGALVVSPAREGD